MRRDRVTGIAHADQPRRASYPLRVAAADDSYLIREAIAALLASSERVELVASCEDGASLWRAIEAENLDVVVVDIRMPPSGDDEGVRIAGAEASATSFALG